MHVQINATISRYIASASQTGPFPTPQACLPLAVRPCDEPYCFFFLLSRCQRSLGAARSDTPLETAPQLVSHDRRRRRRDAVESQRDGRVHGNSLEVDPIGGDGMIHISHDAIAHTQLRQGVWVTCSCSWPVTSRSETAGTWDKVSRTELLGRVARTEQIRLPEGFIPRIFQEGGQFCLFVHTNQPKGKHCARLEDPAG